jgi:hypothetical protein
MQFWCVGPNALRYRQVASSTLRLVMWGTSVSNSYAWSDAVLFGRPKTAVTAVCPVTTNRLLVKGEGKGIPVTGRRDPHVSYSRLTGGGEFSALRTGRLYPQEDSWGSFLLEAESTLGAIVRLE